LFVTVIPTYSHLELHALRTRVSSRLREFGIRAQLPKLELPKLAALAELMEARVQQSDALGRRWLKNVLLGLVLLLEAWQLSLETNKAPVCAEARDGVLLRSFLYRFDWRFECFVRHSVQVLWGCFRN
jgi:uncharacterized membrane protein